MNTVLIVGKIEDPAAEASALAVAEKVTMLPKNWFGRLKRSEIPWVACAPSLTEVDSLNIASVASFLRHAAELEGIPAEGRLGTSKWPNLPDYERMYWIPTDFAKPVVLTAEDGFPFAIGSTPALLRELVEIQRASPYSLGIKPPQFGTDFAGTLDKPQTLQWVWLALNIGAKEAMARNAPLAIA